MKGKYMTPLEAVRKYCLWCCNGSRKEVGLCPATKCELHLFRFGKNPPKRTLRLKTIRVKCLDCSAGSTKEIANCFDKGCPLYSYRFGKNPKLAGKVNKGSFVAKN
jgi:hypothetical protein